MTNNNLHPLFRYFFYTLGIVLTSLSFLLFFDLYVDYQFKLVILLISCFIIGLSAIKYADYLDLLYKRKNYG